MRVALVTEHETLRLLLGFYLQEQGHSVQSPDSHAQLCILDLLTPEAIPHWKGRTPHARILVLAREGIPVEEWTDAGADGCLVRPVELAQILPWLE